MICGTYGTLKKHANGTDQLQDVTCYYCLQSTNAPVAQFLRDRAPKSVGDKGNFGHLHTSEPLANGCI